MREHLFPGDDITMYTVNANTLIGAAILKSGYSYIMGCGLPYRELIISEPAYYAAFFQVPFYSLIVMWHTYEGLRSITAIKRFPYILRKRSLKFV